MYVRRELLGSFVGRDITSKYKGTIMGLFWNVINPLVMLAIYTFLFSVVLRVKFDVDDSTGNFALYLFCGMVPWLAFSESVGRSTGIIMAHQNLVKKTVFPLEILPCYVVISSLVTECFSLIILLGATLFVLKHLSVYLIFLPLLLLLQLMFAMGLACFFASICVFFRDVAHVVNLMLLAWMFLTPIMYPETLIPERLRFIVWMNPMALLVSMFRNVVLEGSPPALWKLGAFSAWAVVVFCAGLFFFKKTKWEFADVI
jgi:lipopolysaccharide transport system permease protein